MRRSRMSHPEGNTPSSKDMTLRAIAFTCSDPESEDRSQG